MIAKLDDLAVRNFVPSIGKRPYPDDKGMKVAFYGLMAAVGVDKKLKSSLLKRV